MADEQTLISFSALIDGRYAVDTAQPYPDAGGGLPAFVAHDRVGADGRRVAIAVSRDLSPRPRALGQLTEPVDNLMSPLGHGPAALAGGKGGGYFVICTPPPGPSVLADLTIWPDKALLDLVLRPAARVLEVLEARRLTHRAIRPNNVFQMARGQPVTLGAAWAAPPAMYQPAVFESPYSAMCDPAGRGEGSIADDVYSLGVLMLTLAGGKVPLANMDDQAVIRWKLDQGSFAALARDVSLSSSMSDLLRGMLADDAEHRPSVEQLLEASHARGRRLAHRPARRSQRPLMLNDIAVFDARMLAFALFTDEKKTVQFLRNGLVTQWLRRGLGDATLAAQVEELVRARFSDTKTSPRGDAMLVMQTINAINPRMPLCWRGIALWPDALPTLLARGIAFKADLLPAVEELLFNDIAHTWSEGESRLPRPGPPDMFALRHLLASGDPGVLMRLFYTLNPLLPCRLPSMASVWIATAPDLLAFLEKTAPADNHALVDRHLAGFIAARGDRRLEAQVSALLGARDADGYRLAELALLADMQDRYNPGPLPALAKWAAARLMPDLERWHNRPRRDAMRERLEHHARSGMLIALLRLADNAAARAADIAGARRASREVAMIDAELASIDHGDPARFAGLERFGQAIGGGIGLSLLILTVLSVMLQ